MTRLYVITTATLTGIIGVLLGVLLSLQAERQSSAPAPAAAVADQDGAPPVTEVADVRQPAPGSVNFADIAARMNPAVVNIDATARGRRARRLMEEGGRRGPDDPFDPNRRGVDAPRRGTGTGSGGWNDGPQAGDGCVLALPGLAQGLAAGDRAQRGRAIGARSGSRPSSPWVPDEPARDGARHADVTRSRGDGAARRLGDGLGPMRARR